MELATTPLRAALLGMSEMLASRGISTDADAVAIALGVPETLAILASWGNEPEAEDTVLDALLL